MKQICLTVFSFLLIGLIPGCQKAFQTQTLQYKGYDIESTPGSQPLVSQLLAPYTDSVGKVMNDEVVELETPLLKLDSGCTLGNFLADAYLEMARQRFNPAADVAFMNSGGIRLNSLQRGSLKRGQVYEVMPFDNLMMLVEVKGTILKKYLGNVTKDRGSGIAGMKIKLSADGISEITVGGKPFDSTATYIMVNSDYVVNGGGNFTGFRNLPARNTGYLLREAILDYCGKMKTQGMKIKADPERRIVYEN